MINFETNDAMTNTYSKIPAILFLLLFVNLSYAQSPKKYYKNGYYEKAFTEATKKQNKKIKLKKKHAQIDWSLSLKQIRNDKVIQSEIKESRVELIHEYASLESGDILALPENIETEVDLDSQPSPSDEDMIKQVKDLYSNDLFSLKLDKKVEELD